MLLARKYCVCEPLQCNPDIATLYTNRIVSKHNEIDQIATRSTRKGVRSDATKVNSSTDAYLEADCPSRVLHHSQPLSLH